MARRAPTNRPWLLFVTPFVPHAPWTPPEEFDRNEVPPWSPNPAVTEEDVSDKPAHLQARDRTARHARLARTERLQTLMSVDVMVGDLMRELGALELQVRRDVQCAGTTGPLACP